MSEISRQNITAERAIEMILSDEPLRNVFISDKLDLSQFHRISLVKNLIADNCLFEFLEASCIEFTGTVKFSNCEFKLCQFVFTYFLGGLTIENCIFENYLDMQAGGHNKNGKAVSISDTTFKGFVNFFDCWYESIVLVKNNSFLKGTNLLGQHTSNIKTTFDVQPIIENNQGHLDVEGEGDIDSRAVYLR